MEELLRRRPPRKSQSVLFFDSWEKTHPPYWNNGRRKPEGCFQSLHLKHHHHQHYQPTIQSPPHNTFTTCVRVEQPNGPSLQSSLFFRFFFFPFFSSHTSCTAHFFFSLQYIHRSTRGITGTHNIFLDKQTKHQSRQGAKSNWIAQGPEQPPLPQLRLELLDNGLDVCFYLSFFFPSFFLFGRRRG